MNIKQLEQVTGGLSKPSKMPGFAYSISAKRCILGSILRKKKGSTCGSCYALKGRYVFPNVQAAMERRFQAMQNENWQVYMRDLIALKLRNKKGADRVFRWHDSGDLQSVAHLESIVWIANELPDVSFWVPTRESKMVREYLKTGQFPSNLAVRLSAAMVGQAAAWGTGLGSLSSTVASGTGYACPAPTQGNECGDCRACWDTTVLNVDYHKH